MAVGGARNNGPSSGRVSQGNGLPQLETRRDKSGFAGPSQCRIANSHNVCIAVFVQVGNTQASGAVS